MIDLRSKAKKNLIQMNNCIAEMEIEIIVNSLHLPELAAKSRVSLLAV